MIPTIVDPVARLRLYATLTGMILGLAVLVCGSLYIWGLQRKVDRLTDRTAIQSADITAAEVHRVGNLSVTTAKEKAKDDTSEALNQNPQYRDGVVPIAVADRLRDRTHSE